MAILVGGRRPGADDEGRDRDGRALRDKAPRESSRRAARHLDGSRGDALRCGVAKWRRLGAWRGFGRAALAEAIIPKGGVFSLAICRKTGSISSTT